MAQLMAAPIPGKSRIAIRTDDGQWHNVGILTDTIELLPAAPDDDRPLWAKFEATVTFNLTAIHPDVLALAFPDNDICDMCEDIHPTSSPCPQRITQEEAWSQFGRPAMTAGSWAYECPHGPGCMCGNGSRVWVEHDDDLAHRADDRRAEIDRPRT